jgi:hypothetical protein
LYDLIAREGSIVEYAASRRAGGWRRRGVESKHVVKTNSFNWEATVCWVNTIPVRVSIQLSGFLSPTVGVREYWIGSEAYHT